MYPTERVSDPCQRLLSILLIVLAVVCCDGCFHRRGPEMVVVRENGALLLRGDCHSRKKNTGCSPLRPTDAGEYASERYDEYRHSGFITLRPDMRLKIVAAVLRPGSKGTQPAAESAPAAPGAALAMTARGSKDLLGYETVTYSLRPASNGAVRIKLESLTAQPITEGSGNALQATDYLAGLTKPDWFRLYFQLRHPMADHDSVLLVADSEGELNEASGEFEQNPDAFCAASHPHTRCIGFPKFTAVNAEIKVYVRKRPVYLPLSGTVHDALTSSGVTETSMVLRKLKIARLWDSHLTHVRFDRESSSILQLPLMGGDRLRF